MGWSVGERLGLLDRKLQASADRPSGGEVGDEGEYSLSRYRVQEAVPVRGDPPANLGQGWIVVRIETSAPILLSERPWCPNGSSAIQFHAVTQDPQYTSYGQRQELDMRSMSELVQQTVPQQS